MVALLPLLKLCFATARRVACDCASDLVVDGSRGIDIDGSGCSDSPLKTMAAALECANPTAKISVRAGTYVAGNMTIRGEVTWEVAGEGEVVFDGNLQRIFDIESGASVSFSNVAFTNGHAIANPVNPDRQQFCDIPLQTSCPGRFGGAIRVTDAQLVCTQCTFKSNVAMCGGAVSTSRSNATFMDCAFDSNGDLPLSFPYALEPTMAGALYAENSTITLNRSSFVNNKITGFRGAAGGAMYLVESTAYVEDNNFTGNIVESSSLCRGGAVYLNYSTASFVRTGFIENGIHTIGGSSSFPTGGAVYAAAKGYGNGIWPVPVPSASLTFDDDLVDGNEPTVRNDRRFALDSCFFQNNYITSTTTSYGAAMLLWNLNVSMVNVQVVNHAAPNALGTIVVLVCAAVVDRSIFRNNSVLHGGAFYMNQHSSMSFSDCTFEHCSGLLGGALFFGYGKFHQHQIHGLLSTTTTAAIVPRADIKRCNFLNSGDGAGPGEVPNSYGGAVYVDGKYDSQGTAVEFTIGVQDSDFDGCKASNGGALALLGAVDLVVSNSTFGARNVAVVSADQVYAQGADVRAKLTSVKMKFSGIAYHRAVSVLYGANISYVGDTTFTCPNGSLVLKAGLDFMCQPCLPPQYNLFEGINVNGQELPSNPNRCFDCPFRADCSIVSTPSQYNPALVTLSTSVSATRGSYGVVSRGQATFYSCPDGYCCDGDVCPLNSCGGNRDPSSLLCGACLPGYSLAVDTPNCIPSKDCGGQALYWLLQVVQWLFWGALWTYQAWPLTRMTKKDIYAKIQIGTQEEGQRNQDEAGMPPEATISRPAFKFMTVLLRPEMRTRYKDVDPGDYCMRVFMAQCITILVTYGQIVAVVIPWDKYTMFFGEVASAESGWIVDQFSSTALNDNSTGWCTSKGLTAADKYWSGYVEGLCLVISGLSLSYIWSSCLAVHFMRFSAWLEVRWPRRLKTCFTKKGQDHASHEHALPLLDEEHGEANVSAGTGRSASAPLACSKLSLNQSAWWWQPNMLSVSQPLKQPGIVNENRLVCNHQNNPAEGGQQQENAVFRLSKDSLEEKSRNGNTQKLMICVLWSALNFSFTRLSRSSIALLTCVNIKEGDHRSSVFLYDATVPCSIEGWQWPAFLMLSLLIFVPLTPVVLWMWHAAHSKRSSGEVTASASDTGLRFSRELASTLNPFRKPCWFWRYLMPLHRLMLVVCAHGFLIPGVTPLSSSLFVVVYCVFMLLLTASFRPYSFRCTNFLEIFCNLVLLLLAILHVPNSAWLSLGRFPHDSDSSRSLFDQWTWMNNSLVGLLFIPIGIFAILIIPVSLRNWFEVKSEI